MVTEKKWADKSSPVKKARPKSLKALIRDHAKTLGISDYHRNKFLKEDRNGVPLSVAWEKFAKEYCKKNGIKYIKFETVAMPAPAKRDAMIKRINTWCKRQGYKGIRKKTFAELWKDNGSEAAIRRAIARQNK